jgi:hypothetical protein
MAKSCPSKVGMTAISPKLPSMGPKPPVNLSQGEAKFRRLPGVPKTFFYVIF